MNLDMDDGFALKWETYIDSPVSKNYGPSTFTEDEGKAYIASSYSDVGGSFIAFFEFLDSQELHITPNY